MPVVLSLLVLHFRRSAYGRAQYALLAVWHVSKRLLDMQPHAAHLLLLRKVNVPRWQDCVGGWCEQWHWCVFAGCEQCHWPRVPSARARVAGARNH